MSDRDKLKLKVAGLRRKRRSQVVLEYLVRGLFWGALPAALVIFASKLWILPVNVYMLAGCLLGATALGLLIAGCFVRITPLAVANEIDLALGLRERVSSALALTEGPQPQDAFVKALMKDAAKRVDKLPVKRVYPWSMPRAWKLALPALLIAAGLSFVPQLNWFISASDRAEAKLVQTEGQKLVEIAKKLEEEATEKKDDVLKKQAEEIRRVGEKLNNGQMQKKEALKELTRLKDKLEAQAQAQVPPGERKLTAELAQQLKQSPSTQKLGERLAEGDMNAMLGELQQLLEQLAQGQLSSLQQQQLRDLLKSLDQALKSDAAKDPTAQELKELMEQLKQSLISEQELREMLQQALDAFAKDLNKLNEQLKQNNMPSQAQQLAQQLKQMQQQMQQQGSIDQQSIQQMAQALKDTQQATQNNQKLSESQKQSLNQACQQALSHLEGQQAQLAETNNQTQQNRAQMAQQMKKQSDCMGGG